MFPFSIHMNIQRGRMCISYGVSSHSYHAPLFLILGLIGSVQWTRCASLHTCAPIISWEFCKSWPTVPCEKMEPLFFLHYSANMYSRKEQPKKPLNFCYSSETWTVGSAVINGMDTCSDQDITPDTSRFGVS